MRGARGLEWAAAAAAGFLGPAQEKRKGAWRAERRRKERGPAGLSPRRDFWKKKGFILFFVFHGFKPKFKFKLNLFKNIEELNKIYLVF